MVRSDYKIDENWKRKLRRRRKKKSDRTSLYLLITLLQIIYYKTILFLVKLGFLTLN